MFGTPKPYETPQSCDELVDLLMSDLNPEHELMLAQMDDDQFESFYEEVADQIVDEFALWTGNSRLLSSCLLDDALDDDASAEPGRVIVEKMRERVQSVDDILIID